MGFVSYSIKEESWNFFLRTIWWLRGESCNKIRLLIHEIHTQSEAIQRSWTFMCGDRPQAWKICFSSFSDFLCAFSRKLILCPSSLYVYIRYRPLDLEDIIPSRRQASESFFFREPEFLWQLLHSIIASLHRHSSQNALEKEDKCNNFQIKGIFRYISVKLGPSCRKPWFLPLPPRSSFWWLKML